METWVLGDLRTWELGDLGTWGLGTWEVGGWGTWGIPKADKAGNLETKGAVQGGLRNFDLGTAHRAWAVGKGRAGVSLLVKLRNSGSTRSEAKGLGGFQSKSSSTSKEIP